MKLPQRPPLLRKLLINTTAEQMVQLASEAFQQGPTIDGRYLHWDELCRRPPPKGLTHEDWWLRLKIARQSSTTRLPLFETSGKQFQFTTYGAISQQLYIIDSKSAGRLEALPYGLNKETGQRYVLSSLVDEAISSSILAGAATTRQDAKRLIARPGEERDVSDMENNLIHKPPAPEELPERLDAMIEFANASGTSEDGQDFLHPVIRSVLLHFCLAYDHPFMDGNGRTARALFYWSMLRHGYCVFEFVSISELLLRSSGAYYKAFQFCEADDADSSYFVVHQLNVLCEALESAEQHIVERQKELRELGRAVRSLELNRRQQETLRWYLAHPGAELTFKEHQHKHGITYQTARTDLMSLADQDLRSSAKSGRTMIYYASVELEKRLFDDGEK